MASAPIHSFHFVRRVRHSYEGLAVLAYPIDPQLWPSTTCKSDFDGNHNTVFRI